MASAAHPLLGVGLGNPTMGCSKTVDGFDLSIDYFRGMTIDPWPSSDWVAIFSERGVPAPGATIDSYKD